MPLRVLITRPREDAVLLADRLAALNIDSIIAPLLTIVFEKGPPLSLENVQALLMTSANGVRAFSRRNQERGLPVFTVGDASATAAKNAGFENVMSAKGDVLALTALVKAKLDPKAGSLLHTAGTRVAGNLAGELQAAGFDVRRETLYAAKITDALPPEARQALQNHKLDGVLIYSPRTAGILTSLIQAAGVEDACRRMTAFCLSQAVADKAQALPWQGIRMAEAPDQDALLNSISQWARTTAAGRDKS